jgi:PAS domain S-box-containing protein
MHSIDKNGILLSVSDFWLEKLGYQRHEVIGKNLRVFLTPESKREADIVLPEFFEKGSIYDVSYHFVTKNGVTLETLLSAIEEGRGTSSPRSLAVVNDVTPLKQAERELRRSRRDLEEAQFIAKLGSFELHLKDNSFTSSEVFDNILELDYSNPKDPGFLLHTTPPEDYEKAQALFNRAVKEEGLFEYVGQALTLKSKKKIWIEILGKVVKEDGIPTKFVGTMQDITRNKTAELEIKELSERLSLATKAAQIGVWEEDLINNKMIWDDEVRKIFQGVSSEDYTDDSALNVSHPDDTHIMQDVLDRLNRGEELIDYSRRIIVENKTKHIQVVVRQIFDENNKATRRVGIVRDVTRDKLLMKQLENSLEEKDILIKEVHHRVKNNMQMISSILALKSLDLTDQDSKNVFDDCTTRIKSMAVVHDQLYRFYNVSEIDISEYLNYLLSGLHTLMGGNAGNFVIDINADEYKMDVDQALLCGLIISEMVANAFKHGFKDHEEGMVKVEFLVKADQKQLIVTNTGTPIPKDVLEIRSSSLGMSLIKTFVTQLEGKIELHPKNGLQVTF